MDIRIICGEYYIKHGPASNFTQPRILIPFRRLRTTHRYYLQYCNNSSSPDVTQYVRHVYIYIYIHIHIYIYEVSNITLNIEIL